MKRANRKVKLLIGAAIILFTIFQYFTNSEINEFTGKKQHIALSTEQEIAIGLQSTPQMVAQHGGLYPDQNYQNFVDQVGQKLVKNSIPSDSPYQFDFHLLKDERTINAFALPGGQIFITFGLFSKLENEDQLAGILGHEIAHVMGRHSAARLSKLNLTKGVLNGVSVGFDPSTAEGVAAIAQVFNLSYGRDDELESDFLGVKIMLNSNYNPTALIGVMKILKEAAGSNNIPERLSTHPDPENRIEKIKEAIQIHNNK